MTNILFAVLLSFNLNMNQFDPTWTWGKTPNMILKLKLDPTGKSFREYIFYSTCFTA